MDSNLKIHHTNLEPSIHLLLNFDGVRSKNIIKLNKSNIKKN